MCSVLRTELQLAEDQARLDERRDGPNALFSAFVLCVVVVLLTVGLVKGCTDPDPGPWTLGTGAQMEAR